MSVANVSRFGDLGLEIWKMSLNALFLHMLSVIIIQYV